MNLFFDTETTGLFDKMDWRTEYKKFPRIVTISWRLHGAEPRTFIVNQNGKKIPAEATAIHGITDRHANDPKLTQPLSFVLQEFMLAAEKADNIIGHNTYYDTSMVQAEVLRLFGKGHELSKVVEEVVHKDKRVCTMRAAMQLRVVAGQDARVFKKWPTLTELHQFLFGTTFEAHNSIDDVLACEKCYYELKKRKAV